MRQNLLAVVTGAAALALCGVGWLALPLLQGAQRTVDKEAAEHLERARRLLHKYDVGWEYKSMLLDRVAEFDVDVEDAGYLIEAGADEYQAEHQRLWEAYQPRDWQLPAPRPRRASYGNLARQIREGIAARTELIDKNRAWLDEALNAVDQAVAVSSGGASSRSYAEAARLKAVIQYHMGLTEWLRARVKRLEAAPYRRELIALAIRSAELKIDEALEANSGVDRQIKTLRKDLADAETRLGTQRKELARLEAMIAGFNKRIAAAEAQASEARRALADLQAKGMVSSDPAGAERFRATLMQHNKLYREARREVQSLKAGYYPHAKIDHTGDFLRGRYVESGPSGRLTAEHGLQHYVHKRDVLTAEIRELERALDDRRADISRLEEMKKGYQQIQEHAGEALAVASEDAAEAYAQLNRVESEAAAFDESALGFLENSARAAARAAKDAKRWIDNARRLTQGISPEANKRSALAKRTRDKWMGGAMIAQEGAAHLARAWVYYGQYQARNNNADVLMRVLQSLPLAEADPEVERVNATQALDAGVEALTRAVNRLKQAHEASNRPWTIVAQEGGALYLLSLFGKASYIDDAIEAYRNAIKGRENEKFAERLVTTLRRLETR
ncbi:MAG: hypothetical protein ACE5HE_04930 [Phycisphaerae bacterium]